MFNRNKYKLIASINLTLALLITACNESKQAQCQRLIKAVNEGTSLIEKNKGSQVTLSLGLAKDLGDISKKIERQNFKDPKVQEFKNQYVKHFEAKSKNIDSAAKALGSAKTAEVSSKGRDQVRQAKKDIETSLKQVKNAAKESDTLAKELNEYCSQSE
ncbi:MAG: hypothetical protein MJK14_12785 [Rivularia sp. ALOHA_DT_140]|nr:hypothetical protein [Rivularia sp. ALOHA_DT_140]